tara:strand:+ start:345 stop:746 length:402 start_codon:yes stop_codon:yes gene_type:complete
MNNKKTADLEYGLKKEDDLFNLLKDKYGDDICKTELKCQVDYESENVIIELKSRRNKYKQYPTTMISKSKIDYMLNSKKKPVCIFNFTDGIYSIEITKDIIEKFQLNWGGRNDRGYREVSEYYYIPIYLLTKM